MKDQFDEKLEAFLQAESAHIDELENDVWKKIDREKSMKKPRRKKHYWLIAAGVTALLVISLVSISTEPVQAFIKNFKEMFVPEKDVHVHIEGDEEETKVELETNELLDYIIYVDTERYKMIDGKQGGKIVPKEDLPANYPEVSMEIWRENSDVGTLIAEMEHLIASEGMTVHRTEAVTYPFDATLIQAYGVDDIAKVKWDTPAVKYFIMEAENNQQFIVKQHYFFEAAEGHAVRFDAMLEHFEVVPAE